MEKKNYDPGQFCWVDLQTPDVDGAKEFYTSLLGWDFRDLPTELGSTYTMFLHNGLATAGMTPQPPPLRAIGAPSVWSSYVCVEDIEATVARALDLEADLIMPPMTMKEGSFAVLQDPTGAVLGLWQAGEHPGAGWVNDTRGFCWNELYTTDVYLARSFYEQLFGWEFERSGPGERAYWTIKNGGRPNGGMMKIRDEWGPVPPSWSVYFAVDSCADSLAKAESLGASVFLAPTKLLKIGTFAGLEDPQGGHFLIMEMVAQDEVP